MRMQRKQKDEIWKKKEKKKEREEKVNTETNLEAALFFFPQQCSLVVPLLSSFKWCLVLT